MSNRNQESIVERKSKKDRESDVDYALQYTRFFLSCIGIWPLVSSKPTRIEKLVSKFVMPYCSIIMFVLILPTYLHLALRDLEIVEYILLVGPLCRGTSNILDHFILISHSDLIKVCVQQIENDWRRIESHSDRGIAMENLKMGRRLSFFCAVGMFGSAIFLSTVMPLLKESTINELNKTVRPFTFPGNDLLIDLEAGYNYEIVFCNSFIAFLMHSFVYNTTFNLATVSVTHASGQIQIIMSRLESLVEEADAVATNNQIASIIRRHVSVLRLTSTIEKLLQEICLVEVFASTIVICLFEYYCLLEWRNENKVAVATYGTILVATMFNIFIYCYIGEHLKEQCEEIGKAAYMIEWYRLPGKSGLALIMIMVMSENPRVLTAGRIVEMSIATFCNIVRSSFAYFGILRALDEE